MTLRSKIEDILYPNEKGLSYTVDQQVPKLLSLFDQTVREVVGEAKPQFLTKEKVKEQIAWCDGRNALRKEILARWEKKK